MRYARLCVLVGLCVVVLFCTRVMAYGETVKIKNRVDRELPDQGIMAFIDNTFSIRLNLLGFGYYRDIETDSIINADNRLDIARYEAQLNIRPEIKFQTTHLELSANPRMDLVYEKWEDRGRLDGIDESDDDIYINEWLARLMVVEELFISYGRQRLLWGPSYLISPSNPFSKENGRNNPYIEIPGMDYGQLLWIPSSRWAVSLIANMDEGRREFLGREFEPTYALKIDYTGHEKYFSLIPSYRQEREEGMEGTQTDVVLESHEWRLGFFGNWSPSDALLIYAEGNVLLDIDDEIEGTLRSQAVIPGDKPEAGDADVLAGFSYTFSMGPTITLEYYHNEGGCTGPIEECIPPAGSADPDDILTRSDYGMVQFTDTNILDVLDIILRWTYDFNDHSSRTTGILDLAIGDYVNLFVVGDYHAGSTDDEFGSVLNYSIFGGIELSF